MAHNNSFTGKIHIFIIRRHFFKNKTNSLLLQSLFYDSFVKNHSAVLHCIFRHCSVPESTLHSSRFVRLA